MAGAALIWRYRRDLLSLWREPVLRRPVLVIESDDWGPGPKADAQQLHRIAKVLSRYKDSDGHPPVMTLGVVLAVPDAELMRQEGGQRYHRVLLSHPRYPAMRDVIQRGVASGVFALQLHGMEHFWPPALMAAARLDPGIRHWLASDDSRTEGLPSHLQSRWMDAASLPSRLIPENQIKAAVTEEVEAFVAIFGCPPRVVVPPTFAWNPMVEKAWAGAGVRVIVTPGQRYEARDHDGVLITTGIASGGRILNGQAGAGGVMYVVRDDYFEPALGHMAEKGLAAVEIKTRLGRPTLLETHRFNFVADPDVADAAINELDGLLVGALQRFPEVVFTSTEQLAHRMSIADASLVEVNAMRRIAVWLLRLREVPRLWKLAWLTGVIVPASLLFFTVRLFCGATPHRA